MKALTTSTVPAFIASNDAARIGYNPTRAQRWGCRQPPVFTGGDRGTGTGAGVARFWRWGLMGGGQ
jgi:hypothetical protein